MKNHQGITVRSALAGVIILASTFTASAATTIGWNNQGVGGTGLADSDTAGAPGFEQSHWNNHSSAGQAPGSVPLAALVDSNGDGTTLAVTGWSQSSNNSWQHGQTGNPNEILMNDFANREPSVSFEGIPYDVYDIVVYYGNNEGPSTSLLTAGAASRTITTGNSPGSSFGAVGFVEGTEANTNEPTNYTVLNGLTGPTQTVSLTGANNNGISAIQFVDATPVPEPGSLGLACLGGLVLLLRRRPGGRS